MSTPKPRFNYPSGPIKLAQLRPLDIMYFHKRGAHGNTEIGSKNFKPSLYRSDCALCIVRLQRYIEVGECDDELVERLDNG